MATFILCNKKCVTDSARARVCVGGGGEEAILRTNSLHVLSATLGTHRDSLCHRQQCEGCLQWDSLLATGDC
jgi:hypothetical protein